MCHIGVQLDKLGDWIGSKEVLCQSRRARVRQPASYGYANSRTQVKPGTGTRVLLETSTGSSSKYPKYEVWGLRQPIAVVRCTRVHLVAEHFAYPPLHGTAQSSR